MKVSSVGGKDGGDLYAAIIERVMNPDTPQYSRSTSSIIAIKTPRGWKVVDAPAVLNEDQAVRYPRLQAWAKEALAKRKQMESQKKVYNSAIDIAE